MSCEPSVTISLVQGPIDNEALLAAVSDPRCGAQVLFVGTTRQWTLLDGREVETDFLVYEAYEEMALKQLNELALQACKRWPVKRVAITHRLDRVATLESSVGVAVSCPHRRESFEAAQWLIDTLKHEIPIWKQEHYVQNGAEWIHPTSGSCRCDHGESKGIEKTESSTLNSVPDNERLASDRSADPVDVMESES